jgi:hypothetical protein
MMRLLPTLKTLNNKGIEHMSADDIALMQAELETLVQRIRERAPLVIGEMCCCEHIHGYGSFKRLPADHEFQPTQGRRPGEKVQIYLELRNFASEHRNGYYETCLESTVTLTSVTADGKEFKWEKNFQDGRTPLRSLTPRNDCFNMYTFCVPPNLPPGQYRLTIQVTDQTRQPYRPPATKSIDFIVGGGQVAQGP